MEDLISVIVPVYNAQKYIDDCVESVKKQTYENVELLFIDDASEDDTYRICCQYASEREWIKCYRREKNGGPGAARNVGIRNAGGKYLYFMDVDDYLDEHALEKLYNAYGIYQVDLVMGNTKKIDVFNSIIIDWPWENKLFPDKDSVKGLIETFAEDVKSNQIFCSVWGKLYRKDIIESKKIFFQETVYVLEDVEFVISYMSNCCSVYYIGECLYTYQHFGNGLASTRFYVQPFDFKHVLARIREILNDDKYQNIIYNCYSEYAIWVMFTNVRVLEKRTDFLKLYRNISSLVNDKELQRAIRYYVQKHDDNAKIIPALIKLRWSLAIIVVFKQQIAKRKRGIKNEK